MPKPRRDHSPSAGPATQDNRQPGSQSEPLTGTTFRVEIDGVHDARAVEVVFPEARIASGRGRKTLVQYGPLTLRRGLTASSEWYQWWNEASRRRARKTPKTVRIILLDRFQADVHRWTVLEAVPVSYQVSPLNALVSAPLLETLELSVRGFEAAFNVSPATD